MLAKFGITLMAKSGFSLKLAHAGEIKGTCAGKISDLRPVLGLGTVFRYEKIPRNILGSVSVIPQKKVLIPRHS